MTAEPQPLSTLRNSAPIHVEAAVAKALAKLPADRFTTARDFADALEGKGLSAAMMAITGLRSAPPSPGRLTRHPLVLGLAAVSLVATAFAAFEWSQVHGQAPRQAVRFSIPMGSTMMTAGTTPGTSVSVSPDGSMIAYVAPDAGGRAHVYVRTLGDVDPRPVQGSDDAQIPIFSPDGQWIAFCIGGALLKVPVGGGTPIPIAELGAFPVGTSWSRSGVIVASVANNLVAIPDNGGPPRILLTPDTAQGDDYLQFPVVLPDGETVVFNIQPSGGIPRAEIAVLSLTTGKLTRLGLLGVAPLGVVDGTLLYVSATGGLFGIPFDTKPPRVTGNPVSLGVTVQMRTGALRTRHSPRTGRWRCNRVR